MNRTLAPLLLCLAQLAIVASPAPAQMSRELREWVDSPVRHLMTRQEERQFRALRTDEEAERFIALFWARRDPDPATPRNEVREDFEARVRAADEQFGEPGRRGGLTDRGQTLILLGMPQGRTFQAARARPGAGSEGAPGSVMAPGGADIWTYERDRLPVSIPASQLHLVFRESRPSEGDFTLDRTDRANRLALKVLAETPATLLLHPELTEVARVGLVPGAPPAEPADLALLATRAWPEGAWAVAVPGVQDLEVHPVWIHVRLPAGAPAVERIVGRVSPLPEGESVGDFAVEAEGFEVPRGTAYELAVPLTAGGWEVDLALIGAAGPVAVRTFEVESTPVEPDQPWISPVYWGGDVQDQGSAPPGAPFNIGGWHVVPRPDDEYYPPSSVEIFAAVLQPTVADGAAGLEVVIELSKEGRSLMTTDPEAVALSHVRDELWMYGRPIPLAAFPGSGAYRITVTLREPASGVERTTTIPIELQELGE